MSVIHSFTIDDWRPTSLNKLLGMHWAVRRKVKTNEMNLVILSAIQAGVPRAKRRRRGVSMHITLPPGARRYDYDNCWKIVLDALVSGKFLVNDSPKWVHTGPVTHERGERLSTTIRLEDMDA